MAARIRRRRVADVGRTGVNGTDAAGTHWPAAARRARRRPTWGRIQGGTRRLSMSRTTHGPGTDRPIQDPGEAGRRDPPEQRGETRMVNVQSIDDLAQRLAAMVPPGLKEARDDLTKNFKSALQAGLRELDLVTREEFDVQRCVLLRTREKIEELEAQVAH